MISNKKGLKCLEQIILGIILLFSVAFSSDDEVLVQTPWQDNQNENGTLVENQNWDATMGYEFTPNKNGVIVGLGGYYDGSATIYIWNSSGAILAQTNVASSNTWEYVQIDPLSVELGETYRVGAYLGDALISYRWDIGQLPKTYGDIVIQGSFSPNGDTTSASDITSAYIDDINMYGQLDIMFSRGEDLPPSFTSTPNTSAIEGIPYQYLATANDPDGDNAGLTYSFTNNPSGMTITSNGLIKWTPSGAAISNDVSVRVTDIDGSEVIQSFSIVVESFDIGTLQTPWGSNENGNLSFASTFTGSTKGYRFEPKTNGMIYALGGLYNSTAPIYLWKESTGEIIAQTIVTSSNEWEYNLIEPVAVVAGEKYIVAVYLSSGTSTSRNNIQTFPRTYGDIIILNTATVEDNKMPHGFFVSSMKGQVDIMFSPSAEIPNQIPEFVSDPIRTAFENQLYEYAVIANDPGGNNADLIYSLPQKPNGMTIDSNTGAISWTPSPAQVGGDHPVTIQVADEFESALLQEFKVSVLSTEAENIQTPWKEIGDIGTLGLNQYGWDGTSGYEFVPSENGIITELGGLFEGIAPVYLWKVSTGELLGQVSITSANNWEYSQLDSGPVGVGAGESYIVAAYISESVNGTLGSYRSGISYPQIHEDITILNASHVSGDAIPTDKGFFGMTGQVDIRFTPTDEIPNQSPEITSEPITTVDEDVLYEYTVQAIDVGGDIEDLRYSLTSWPEGMIIDPISGLITWTPIQEQVGSHSVEIKVMDSENAEDTQPFTITVEAVNDKPVITGQTPNPLVANENEAFFVKRSHLIISDEDNDFFISVFITLGDGENISTDGRMVTPDSNFIGLVSIPVMIDDTSGGRSEPFDLQIDFVHVNRNPIFNSTPIETATEGIEYTYTAQADDSDGENTSLVYSLILNPTGMTIIPNTGLISWTPDEAQNGSRPVTVKVIDADGGEATQEFFIEVESINDAPVITGQVQTPQFASEDVPFTIDLSHLVVSDPDNNYPFDFSLPPGSVKLDPDIDVSHIQSISGNTITPVANYVGPINVLVRVNDGSLNSDYFNLKIDFQPVNDNPTITSEPVESVVVLQPYEYTVSAEDVDGDEGTLLFSLTEKPEGMTIDVSSGLISWTPSETQIGEHVVIVNVRDEENGRDSQSFNVTVEAVAAVIQKPWKNNQNGFLIKGMNNWNFTMGYQFTFEADGVITGLGGFYKGTAPVYLWNSSGTLLTQVSVTSSNNWEYKEIDAISVFAGETYTVAAYVGDTSATFRFNIANFPQTYSDITIEGSVLGFGNGEPVWNINTYMFGQVDIIFSPNHPPVITEINGPDFVSVSETVKLSCKAYDIDLLDQTLNYTWEFGDASAPESGTDMINVSHTFIAAGNYVVKLVVEDSASLSDTMTFPIIVLDEDDDSQADNSSPITVDDFVEIFVNTIDFSIDVLANDFDMEGDGFDLISVSLPKHGEVFMSGDFVKYTPPQDFAGMDSFTYTVEDEFGSKASGKVIVVVDHTNHLPQGMDDLVATDVTISIVIDALANDTDEDFENLIILDTSEANNGIVVNNESNITYTPQAGFQGVDVFTYTIKDENGGVGTATVTVRVGVDLDNDNMPDHWEFIYGLDMTIDDSALDPDGDGVENVEEYTHNTSPMTGDTDLDGCSDYLEIQENQNGQNNDTINCLDTDGDGMPDVYENMHDCLNVGVNDAGLDANANGRINLIEWQLGTPPCVSYIEVEDVPGLTFTPLE